MFKDINLQIQKYNKDRAHSKEEGTRTQIYGVGERTDSG